MNVSDLQMVSIYFGESFSTATCVEVLPIVISQFQIRPNQLITDRVLMAMIGKAHSERMIELIEMETQGCDGNYR